MDKLSEARFECDETGCVSSNSGNNAKRGGKANEAPAGVEDERGEVEPVGSRGDCSSGPARLKKVCRTQV